MIKEKLNLNNVSKTSIQSKIKANISVYQAIATVNGKAQSIASLYFGNSSFKAKTVYAELIIDNGDRCYLFNSSCYGCNAAEIAIFNVCAKALKEKCVNTYSKWSLFHAFVQKLGVENVSFNYFEF